MTKKKGKTILKHAIRIEKIYRDLDLFDSVQHKNITVRRVSDKIIEIEIDKNPVKYTGQPICIGC